MKTDKILVVGGMKVRWSQNATTSEYDAHIEAIFEAIKQLMAPPVEKPKPRIGFHP